MGCRVGPPALCGRSCSAWRFPEPPIDMDPNMPWLLHQGESISEPAPWMVETATLVLATVSRYYGVYMASSPVFADDDVPPALAALLVKGALESEVHLRRDLLGGTYTALLRVPYDYGIVAIDLAGPELAHVYSWTFGDNWRLRHRDAEHFGDLVRNAFFTDHTLTSLMLGEDGVWRIDYHVSASRHWERPSTAGLPLLSGGYCGNHHSQQEKA